MNGKGAPGRSASGAAVRRMSVADVRQAAAAVEDLGYGTLWLPETTGR